MLLICATVFLACSDATSKYLALTLPPVQVTWMRFAVFAVIMTPMAFAVSPNAMRSSRPMMQIARGAMLLASSVLFVCSLKYLPIAEASATAFVSPVFVTALSIFVLGESVGVRRWVATVVGLAGVLVVVRPGTAAFHPASMFSILSALAWASTLILTRLIAGADRPVTTMAYAAVTGVVLISFLVPFVWVTPGWREIALAVVIGSAATAGHWIVILAFRYADASVLAPFSYTQLIWVTCLGLVIFGEIPDGWTVGGAALIIGSGLYTAHRERVRRSILLPTAVEPSANA